MVEWARRGTGFDYRLGPPGSLELLFQDKTRLEVSGIRRGEDAGVLARERRKLAQMARAEGVQTQTLPGIVVVVEFGAPR